MGNPIQESFDQVHASLELKENTRAQVLQAMERQSKPARAVWKPLCVVAACLLLVLGLGGWKVYFTPTSVISVDINPSIELDINALGRVIDLHGYNEDGVELAASLDVLHQNYQQAVDEILNSDTILDCLDRGEFLSVSVVELSGDQGGEITAYVSQCTQGHHNMSCSTISSHEAQEAHHVGLSYGKYDIYLDIVAYDPSFTPQQANTMTIRELRDLLASLEEATPEGPSPTVDNTGNGNGNGNGNQHGHGNGNHK